MSEQQSTAEKAEAAAIRRRWITLGEIVAIGGLGISALALWSGWSDRRTDERERQLDRAVVEKAQTAVLLSAAPMRGGEALLLADPAHPIQGITVTFPKALGIAAQSSAASPRIDASWIAPALLRLTDGGADGQRGRVPVIIAADYWQGDRRITDTAIYDIIWHSDGRLLRGRTLRLDGVVLHARKDATQAALDTRWAQLAPDAAQ